MTNKDMKILLQLFFAPFHVLAIIFDSISKNAKKNGKNKMEMYEIVVEHEELGKYRVIRGRDFISVKMKAAEQQRIWDEAWKKQETHQNGEDEAKALTLEAKEIIKNIENYLEYSIGKKYIFDKDIYKIFSFDKISPKFNKLNIPTKPLKSDDSYIYINYIISPYNVFALGFVFIVFSYFWNINIIYGSLFSFLSVVFFVFLKMLLKKISKKKIKKKFRSDLSSWKLNRKNIEAENIKIEKDYQKKLKAWKKEKDDFLNAANINNNKIDSLYEKYKQYKSDGVIFYIEKNLEQLPESVFPIKKFEISYNDQNKILLINSFFPVFEEINPLAKEAKYIKSKDVIQTTNYPDSFVKKMYDTLIYQHIFSIIHCVYTCDIFEAIDSLVINGYLDAVDKSLGKQTLTCITSLQIDRKEFIELDLRQIEPKQCFKRLKGISAVQLESKTPVKPVMQLNTTDKRFVESYNVAENIDVGTNLAAIDWQDFENLIRELFAKKFSSNGGECKVTQASRDGGVDAIAFDPDPILGGKVVIQAKRYTNVVGVSAVRDLYGTLISEGASKGILITTSDFGTDAHNFAKGKPIILLNGNNLLHLLNEFGTEAYINIPEAKKILKQEE